MAIDRQPRSERDGLLKEHSGGAVEQEKQEAQGPWGDASQEEPPFQPLTAEEAQALRAKHPPLSPWRVVGVQAVLGSLVALLVALITNRWDWAGSLLYGAACVVLPGALMARGVTSRLARLSPGASVVSFMVWEGIKVVTSVVMLALAPKVVQNLAWPALLVGLVLCLKSYWVALLWRGSKKN